MSERGVDCSELVGLSESELSDRFGAPKSRAGTAGALWLVHETDQGQVRLRLSRTDPESEARVASWTLNLRRGRDTLRQATEALGLWPAAAPDVAASDLDLPLARRPLPAPGGERMHSLTASIRQGRFTRVSVFDEAPDWL